ncbi:MAG: SPOR domain-containing protein [Thermoanaerobaculia bacterium]
MTDSHEPSYYEIALTNRQVLTVFVILLACVVAAFFAGVWIGHRDVGPAGTPEIAERQEQEEPVPEDEEGRPLRELRFFTEDSAEAAAEETPTPAAEPDSPDSTLLQDLDGSPPEKPSGAKKPLPSLLPPEFTAEPVVAEKDEPTPAAAAPAPAPVVSTPAPAPAGELVIQVFFSSDQEKARNLVAQLAGGGFPAFLSPVEVGGETMYRVRLGPYEQRSAAEAAAERVRRNYKLDTWITQ